MKKFGLIALLLCLTACANTEYAQWEGKNSVIEGQGGTKEVVDGMEFWTMGDPPRKYKVLGVIQDSRPSGIISMSALKKDMVFQARKAGGDAVILLNSNKEFTGFVNTGSASGNSTYTAYGNTLYAQHNASSFGNTIATSKHHGQYVVVKYLK